MATRRLTTCDRCGKEIEYQFLCAEGYRIKLTWFVGDYFSSAGDGKMYDFCRDCAPLVQSTLEALTKGDSQ